MVTRLVVCRREGVERMVVRWAGVKSSTSFSTTDVDLLLAVEDREERREEERARRELGMMEEVEGGGVKRTGSNCASRTGCITMR